MIDNREWLLEVFREKVPCETGICGVSSMQIVMLERLLDETVHCSLSVFNGQQKKKHIAQATAFASAKYKKKFINYFKLFQCFRRVSVQTLKNYYYYYL